MPQPVLAAVVIAASISLFDVAELRRLYAHPQDRVRAGRRVRASGVAFVGVLQGIVIAVVLSVVYIFKRAWSPYSTVLGKAPGVPGYHDIRRYPDATQVPGLLIVRWSAPLFFANANQFRDRIRRARQERPTRRRAGSSSPPSRSPTSTRRPGAMLADLDLELNAGGIHLAFAELQSDVRDTIVRYGLLETIDEGHFYRSVDRGGRGVPAGGRRLSVRPGFPVRPTSAFHRHRAWHA